MSDESNALRELCEDHAKFMPLKGSPLETAWITAGANLLRQAAAQIESLTLQRDNALSAGNAAEQVHQRVVESLTREKAELVNEVADWHDRHLAAFGRWQQEVNTLRAELDGATKWSARCGVVQVERDVAMEVLKKITQRNPHEPSHSKESMVILANNALNKIGNALDYTSSVGARDKACWREVLEPFTKLSSSEETITITVKTSDVKRARAWLAGKENDG